jgi:hypothetical protein
MSGDDDDNDELDITLPSGGVAAIDPSREIGEIFDDLEELLKNGDVMSVLSTRGINCSLALVAVQGLRFYLTGDKAQAAEDLAMVAEEIRARMEAVPSAPRTFDHGSKKRGGGSVS